jgi:hypothetical protein
MAALLPLAATAVTVRNETPAQDTLTLHKLVTDIQTIDGQFSATVDAINHKLKAA